MIIYSKHASQQLKERGITKELVKLAIERGSKILQRKNEFLASYTYIKVAYKKISDVIFVKTVMIKEKQYKR